MARARDPPRSRRDGPTTASTSVRHWQRYGQSPKRGFDEIGLCDCKNGKDDCELLPDLVIIPAFTQNQIEEYAYNDLNYPGQLRFAATIGNIGYGPMEVVGTKEWVCGNTKVDSGTICKDGLEVRQRVKQRIYSKKIFHEYYL